MTDRLNRCPHCWAALAEVVGPYCPICAKSLVKVTRRGGRKQAESAVVTAPTPDPAHAPAPSYVPLEAPGAPTPPLPPPSGDPAWAAPAASAVAVLEAEERDPVEFPGQPLPPGFFSSLPERGREQARYRPPRQFNPKLIGVAVALVAVAVGAVGQWSDRNDAIDSPARHLVAGACAEYREISIRLERDEMDVAAAQQGLAWLQNNLGRFEEAARLDPELQGAADYIRWFNQMFQDPAALARISQAEFDQREEPLAKACTFGAGRA